MRIIVFILVFISFIQLSIGQNELVKIDTIYNSNGIPHRIINYKSESESNHFNLALKCKEKADSLLKAYFDLKFFKEHIYLDAGSSHWYNINNRGRTTQIFDYKKEKPKKVELVYSILNKNSLFFDIIITIECENEIKIVNSKGIPKTKNYKINVDYNKAQQIAKKKGFKNNINTEEYDIYSTDLESLSLDFSNGNDYQWIIHKNIKRKIDEKTGNFKIHSKALFIDARTGKTKTKRIKRMQGNIRWF